MVKRLTSSLLILGCAMLAAAQQSAKQSGLEDPPWLEEIVHKRIVYSVPGMKRVRVRRDLIYKRASGEELKLDLYSPGPATRGRRPAIIFIHGGRIPRNLLTKPKNWGAYVSFGELAAASGFVAVTFNHRFYSWESLADSQSDLMDLIAYVRSNADSFGVDKDQIVLWSVSAGGIFLSQPLRELPAHIRCIVAYYSELDLQNERKTAPASVSDETLREFSPVYHLSKTKNAPPLFIARAGLDDPTLNDGLDRFVQAALANNLSLELMNHAGGQHGFDIEDDNERSREILRRTIQFIQAHTSR